MTEFEPQEHEPEPIDPVKVAAAWRTQADIADQAAGYALDFSRAEAVIIAREMARQDRLAAVGAEEEGALYIGRVLDDDKLLKAGITPVRALTLLDAVGGIQQAVSVTMCEERTNPNAFGIPLTRPYFRETRNGVVNVTLPYFYPGYRQDRERDVTDVYALVGLDRPPVRRGQYVRTQSPMGITIVENNLNLHAVVPPVRRGA